MITIQTDGNIIYTIARQELTNEDYNILIPALERLAEGSKSIRWYFEMQDFKGWELQAFWKDVKFDLKHRNDFEKVAMIGEKRWEQWLAEVLKPFTKATVKYFELESKQE